MRRLLGGLADRLQRLNVISRQFNRPVVLALMGQPAGRAWAVQRSSYMTLESVADLSHDPTVSPPIMAA